MSFSDGCEADANWRGDGEGKVSSEARIRVVTVDVGGDCRARAATLRQGQVDGRADREAATLQLRGVPKMQQNSSHKTRQAQAARHTHTHSQTQRVLLVWRKIERPSLLAYKWLQRRYRMGVAAIEVNVKAIVRGKSC
ncbi:hypothetical protein PHSY_005498 [Pseudozyma hubeiensis SY62]|uniref:Uncharacterized protein n=1 Tax=Pseudozyma hubeiensis (strain SY62) TaxID=1305764 RepID=R9PIJ7_PSEHS|nr:hypothetical protein PHSY_005498 [Pseudozyma hubeiensis SY62]GAC97910.1 hypothetical protein PHSY_005498 [Pseudozyma hubeiensis SY62]